MTLQFHLNFFTSLLLVFPYPVLTIAIITRRWYLKSIYTKQQTNRRSHASVQDIKPTNVNLISNRQIIIDNNSTNHHQHVQN